MDPNLVKNMEKFEPIYRMSYGLEPGSNESVPIEAIIAKKEPWETNVKCLKSLRWQPEKKKSKRAKHDKFCDSHKKDPFEKEPIKHDHHNKKLSKQESADVIHHANIKKAKARAKSNEKNALNITYNKLLKAHKNTVKS
jgi:hypothetical protein